MENVFNKVPGCEQYACIMAVLTIHALKESFLKLFREASVIQNKITSNKTREKSVLHAAIFISANKDTQKSFLLAYTFVKVKIQTTQKSCAISYANGKPDLATQIH